MRLRYLALCGMIAPILFMVMTILGGALRPGYSHLADTISELFSPGSPNKLLLDTLHTLFAILLILFGFGVLQFINTNDESTRTGKIGAFLYILMGFVNIFTATIFPQDPWGTPATFRGQMHINLSGVIGILSIIAFILIGIWFKRTKIIPWFGAYSFITVVAVIISTGLYIASIDTPLMGLAERISALLGFQWTFVLALQIFMRSD